MSKATDFEDFELVSGRKYRTKSPLIWEVGGKGSGWWLRIPSGFPFDSSVPKLLHLIVNPHHEAWLLAAAIHDYLLSLEWCDKAFAAGEWYRAVKARRKHDSKSWLAKPAYYGVVLWTVR